MLVYFLCLCSIEFMKIGRIRIAERLSVFSLQYDCRYHYLFESLSNLVMLVKSIFILNGLRVDNGRVDIVQSHKHLPLYWIRAFVLFWKIASGLMKGRIITSSS